MRFLHIDDDELDRDLTKELVKRTKHWEYFSSCSIMEGLKMWEEESPQVVLIDVHFPGEIDSSSYGAIETMSKTTCVIALSGSNDFNIVNKCRDAGAVLFLNKDALSNPLKFHDHIIKSVEKNLSKSIAKNPAEELLRQLAEAVFYGNGKPSILARLEAGDVRMQSIEFKIDDIAEVQGNTRFETRMRGWAMIILLIFTFILQLYKIHQGQHSDGMGIPMEEINSAK